MLSRRRLLLAAARPRTRVKSFELLPVRVTERTVWLFVRVTAHDGLTGLGEASDAFGLTRAGKAEAQRLEQELRSFFSLIQGRSPLDVEAFRQQAWPRLETGGVLAATAFSALEHALWDLAGQALGVPVYDLFGGRVRSELPLYANINRSVRDRVPAGFVRSAKAAWAEGYRHFKLAPFDGFPPLADTAKVQAALDNGVACIQAVREALGPEAGLMVDCHSFFTVPMAIETAERLRAARLAWYEEPVAPEKLEETAAIKQAIPQTMAGGEFLFGTRGFAPLCQRRAVDVIMPDVKHCGGLLEFTRIAALAAANGVGVSPHNPTGPVATAASVQVCAGLANFKILEVQWGEAPWRADLLNPVESLAQGIIRVPDTPGLGVRLNDRVLRQHLL